MKEGFIPSQPMCSNMLLLLTLKEQYLSDYLDSNI